MIFEYDVYYNGTFVTPIIAIIIVSVWLFAGIYPFLKKRTQGDSTKILLCVVFIGVFFIALNIMSLINGGACLYKEKEEDAILEMGTIEKIVEPSKSIPNFRKDHKHGADVIIDGEEYFMITCEGFEVGDYVEIEYLPKSKFVLSIYEAEPPSVESDTVD